jgi:hypothetical protein
MTTTPQIDTETLIRARAVEDAQTLELEWARQMRMSTGEWLGQVRKPETMDPRHFDAVKENLRERVTQSERAAYLDHVQAVAAREALEKELAGEQPDAE